jgi:hypothetical protein
MIYHSLFHYKAHTRFLILYTKNKLFFPHILSIDRHKLVNNLICPSLLCIILLNGLLDGAVIILR